MTRSLWILAVAVMATLALFPMRLMLAVTGAEVAGLAVRQVRGSIWSATASDMQLATVGFGNVAMGVSPFALITGRLRLDIERPATDLRGPLSAHWQRSLLGSTHAAVTGTVDGPSGSPLPIEAISFDNFTLTMDGDGCTATSGSIRLSLRTRIAGLDLRNGLTGAPSCRSGALVIPMVGQSGMERLTLTLRPDRSYRARLQVRADDPLLAAALAAAGLQPVAGGFGLDWQGQY